MAILKILCKSFPTCRSWREAFDTILASGYFLDREGDGVPGHFDKITGPGTSLVGQGQGKNSFRAER